MDKYSKFWNILQYNPKNPNMSSINLEFGFNVPRKVIYEAFVDQMKVMQYTRSKAEVQNAQGGSFSMMEGRIQGKFLTLRPGEYIKMEWKFNDWPSFSIVELIFQDPEDDECDLVINQTKIPAGIAKDKLESGWKNHIIEPMSKILGYPLKD